MDDLTEEEMMALAISESLAEANRSVSDGFPRGHDETGGEEEAEGGGGEMGTTASPGGGGGAPVREGVSHRRPSSREEGCISMDMMQGGHAILIGTGWEGCDNEDDAITGHPLRELDPLRVVRFNVSSTRRTKPTSNATKVEGEDDSRKHGEEAEGGGGGGVIEEGSEAVGGVIMHGYDAVYLARWLSRDARLPLTFHGVCEADCIEVLRVMRATVTDEEVDVMLERGEILRDAETGELIPNTSQGATSRLVGDGEGEYECLDWEYFLVELDRLSAQIVAARHQLMLDRGYGRRPDSVARMQALSELDVRVEARRSQLRHITSNFDASEILADLYHMADIVKSVRSGGPLELRDPTSPLVSRSSNEPRRLSALDADNWEYESEDDYEYEHCDVAYGGKLKQKSTNGGYKSSASKAGVRARW